MGFSRKAQKFTKSETFLGMESVWLPRKIFTKENPYHVGPSHVSEIFLVQNGGNCSFMNHACFFFPQKVFLVLLRCLFFFISRLSNCGDRESGFICRVGIDIPTIEVRFEHLNVEAEAHEGSRALPTLINFCTNIVEVS